MYPRLLLLLMLLTFTYYSNAQDLTGIWKGYFITEMGEQYKLEFQVKQAGARSVTGVSYSYLDTKRDYLNFPYAIRPNFAAKHTANLVVKKFVTKLKTQFNGSYTFATGRPYYDIRLNNSGRFVIADEGKTIPYHSMSFSVNYLPSIGKQDAKRFTVVVFSINNVLGSDQVFGYNYSYNGSRKEPILPTARRFFFLGCFISFGVDRSDDVINSNLYPVL